MSTFLSRLKDNKRRFVFKNRESKYLILDWVLNAANSKRSFIYLDSKSQYNINKFIYKQKTYTTKPNQSRTRIRNQCVRSGRQRSSSRFFRRSRLSLLEELKVTQKFPGVTRASYSK